MADKGIIDSAIDEAPSGGHESTGVKSVGDVTQKVVSAGYAKKGTGLTETPCEFGVGPGKAIRP